MTDRHNAPDVFGGGWRPVVIDLLTAFRLLTRLPVGGDGSGEPGRCVWAFPIVGLAVNALGGLVYWLAHGVGMPPALAAVWTVAAAMAATGALHEDGLADTADGFGGGASPERKLEIMRDSRIGSYGALALLLTALLRVASLAALADPGHVLLAFCLAGILGRGGILVLLLAQVPARQDGLGFTMGSASGGAICVGLGLTIVATLAAARIGPALVILLAAGAAAAGVGRLAGKQIGGYTGDVLGCAEVIGECVVLSVAVVIQ